MGNDMKKIIYFVVVLLFVIFVCESFVDGIYNNVYDLMVEVICIGSVFGVMIGDIVKKFSDQFCSNGLLLVSVKVEKCYK